MGIRKKHGKIEGGNFMTNNISDIQKALSALPGSIPKLGETVLDAINEDDNYARDIGKHLFNALMQCNTQREMHIANQVVIGITGYSIESILERIEERDKDGYEWESTPNPHDEEAER